LQFSHFWLPDSAQECIAVSEGNRGSVAICARGLTLCGTTTIVAFTVLFAGQGIVRESSNHRGGGREHALVWKLRESPRVEKIWCAPGNGGIAAEAEGVGIDAGSVAALAAFAEKVRPDLTVVGPSCRS